MLFVRGDLELLDGRRAGVVGLATPRSRAGDGVGARSWARRGRRRGRVRLAKGIDGSAHRGVLRVTDGRAVAVVGNGTDVPTPVSTPCCGTEICERGLAVVGVAAGHGAEAFRFPMRNRILAALSEVLVVVESRQRGGSLITARAAIERDVDVMAVPGSVRNRAAVGTNQLLRDGAAPVVDVGDVLVALGLDNRRVRPGRVRPSSAAHVARRAKVLETCRRRPRTLDDIVRSLELPISAAAMALARLERTGWVRESGGWFEAVVSWSEQSVTEYPRPSGEPAPDWRTRGARRGPRPATRRAGLVSRLVRQIVELVVRAHGARVHVRRPRLRSCGRRARGPDTPAAVKRTTARRYLAFLSTRQYARRKAWRARDLLLRRYFAWLVRTGRLRVDPTVGLQARGGDGRLPLVRSTGVTSANCSMEPPHPGTRRAGLAAPSRRPRARGATAGGSGSANCAASTSPRSTW